MPRRLLAAVVVLAVIPAAAHADVTKSYTYEGLYALTVPTWVTKLHVRAVGGRGGSGSWASLRTHGGRGALVSADVPVGSSTTVFVSVGAGGGNCGTRYGGGGATSADCPVGNVQLTAGSGGGASDLRTVAGDLATRLVVAAGGGGASSNDHGGDAGADGVNCIGAKAGTQSAGGAAGGLGDNCAGLPSPIPATAGAFGVGGRGGRAGTLDGGGGGAGWYGGGGGMGYGSGAGGSSHVAPGVTNASITTTDEDPRVDVTYPGYTLKVTATGAPDAGGYVDASGGIDCGYNTSPARTACAADHMPNDAVTLTAHPGPYSAFAGFSGGGCSGTGTTCTVIMSAASQVTATFVRSKPTNTVTVGVSGAGAGTVIGDAGFDCGGGPAHATCTLELTPGPTHLWAIPAENSVFTGWVGCPSTTTACTLPAGGNGPVTATAVFAPKPRTLTIARTGTGGGTVTGPGIDCGPAPGHTDCAETVLDGTKVALTATPAANSDFTGFSGGGCPAASTPCTVTVTSDLTVSAGFRLKQRMLWVVALGSGSASITGPGIDCGPGGHDDCSEPFPDGAAVTLSVTPAPNTELAGLVGGGCVASPCTVTLTAETTVVALIQLRQRTLTVAGAGDGAGHVDADPAGIDCGHGADGHAACAADYEDGTVVTLTAHPAPGSTFTGFSGGGCAGHATTCAVTMTQARAVTATFGLEAPAPGPDGPDGPDGPAAPDGPQPPPSPLGTPPPSVFTPLPDVPPPGVTGAGPASTTTARPSNAFTLIRARASARTKAITVRLRLPGRGTVRATAKGYKSATLGVRGAGARTLTLRPTARTTARRKRAKVTVAISYTPTGGVPAVKRRTVTV
jgi:hypothetical protein